MKEYMNQKGNVKPFEYNGIKIVDCTHQELMNLLALILEGEPYKFTFDWEKK